MSNGAGQPHVWILKGPKAGDFVQMRALANALGWPFEVRNLKFRPWELLLHAIPHATLAGVREAESDRLEAPWPDLVLTAGRRNEMPALWIRRAAGGSVRIVHVGRPWSHPSRFDAVISNAQYHLTASDRVLVNALPLNEIGRETLATARAAWSARLTNLPRPLTTVLVGGSSGPFVLTTRHGAELGRRLRRFVSAYGGSVLLSDSARTPAGVIDALLAEYGGTAFVHRFGGGGENPYLGFLAAADRLVVTADSVSMVAEACATGRPVFVYAALAGETGLLDGTAWRWRPVVHRLSHWFGPRRMRRDVMQLHRGLIAAGRARWFDDAAAPFVPADAPADDLARAVARVKALFGAASAG